MKSLSVHLGLIALLFVLCAILPAYHQGNFARVMVLAIYAMGYNVLFGYTGLLSLGHAMFFAAGMYGTGLASLHWGTPMVLALPLGGLAGALLAAILGVLFLRAKGVGFMIVTLMFAQTVYLTILYFGETTGGDEGFVLQPAVRVLAGFDLTNPNVRYLTAWALFSLAFLTTYWLVRRPFGKTLVAIRENEERARMIGYDTFRYKWQAVVISGALSGLAGATYGMLFGYVGASFATVQYSIFPLLWVLLGGAGTVLGPFVGTLFMFYLIDFSSEITTAYMLIAGVVLVLLTLFAPQGIVGELRRRLFGWLP
ncbi:MAG: branched-chain amino acid ABC transporter permease [Paracoccaceae bacterium]